MLGIRASFREDSEFSPAEAVFVSQLVLPDQFVNTPEVPSFLKDLQTTMNGRLPPPTWHNSAPAPSTLPKELLLTRFAMVRQDGAQPPLSPIYDGPYRVLERSTHFFLLEMGEKTDKVSTLCLKAARSPANTEPAKPLPRCAGATCPRATAKLAGASGTGDPQLPPTNATNNNSILIISIRPSSSQRPAAEPTQPLCLSPQSLGGTCGGVPSVPTTFPALTVT
jgi:hypothetical protein